jgi:hypothetical protein
MKLEALFAGNMWELAEEMRKWEEDPKRDFPFAVSGKDSDSPINQSVFELFVHPLIDRFWYVERPIVLRVRSASPIEQWDAEARYWDSVGDHERATLRRSHIVSAKKSAE